MTTVLNLESNSSIDSLSDDYDNEFEFFTEEDKGNLIENTFYMIETIITKNPLIYNEPNYQEQITNDIIELFLIQFAELYEINIHEKMYSNKNDGSDSDDYLEVFKEELLDIINQSFKLFHKHILPKRSFKRTFIRKYHNIPQLSCIIEHLKNKPQPEQKTEEWYAFRYKTLTASNIWKAFGTQSVKNQLIYEKCNPININKFSTSIETPMHWGHKYEPISVMYYEKRYNTKVGEFGCLLHDDHDFIAASPDGINIDETSKRYGRMLEIKNIVNREINGIPKLEYWIQMQIQMEVCNLNECDFLETRFVEYESKTEFDNDGTFNYTHNNKLKGVIMMFNKPEGDGPLYVYPPLKLKESEFELWEESTMNQYNDLVWIHNIYWKLETVSCVLVLRNKLWFKAAIPVLNDIWDTIKREKIEGFEHRAPNKRINKRKCNDEDEIKNKCLINVSMFKSEDEEMN